jgi:hypothetical protein
VALLYGFNGDAEVKIMIRRSTWIIFGIFLLLVASTLIWQRYRKEVQAKVTPTAEQEMLLNLTSKVTDLRIEGVESQIVEIVRDEQGQWKLSVPEGHESETNTESVEAAVSQLSNLSILSSFEQGLDLGGAGLVVPSYRITIGLEDGQKIVVNVGKETTTGSGYYVLLGEKGVYVVSKYSIDSIIELLQNPPIKPTPTVSVETETLPVEVTTPITSTATPATTSSP